MNIVRLILLLSLIATFTQAQKKPLTIEEAVYGSRTYLKPQKPKSLQWRNENQYVLVKNDTLFQFDAANAQKEVLLTLADFKEIELHQFPSFDFIDDKTIKFKNGQNLVLYNVGEKKFLLNLKVPSEAENLDFCNSNQTLAYTKGQNLYILTKDGEKQITFDQTAGILNGHYVHRREFGISKGTFWSSTGKYLAFYRKDESMVKDYPLVDYMAREADYTPVKYPMAGMKSHEVTVGIYNLESGETTFLKTGKPDDHYLTNISWGPKDQYLYMAELNRNQDHMQMNQYDVSTGKMKKTLFEETSNTYVEPQHPIIFSDGRPDQFYYWSRKDGWFHLYLYDTSGKQIRQVTKGKWEVTDFYGADKTYAYIQATRDTPVDRHIYKVKLSNGAISRLDQNAGTHEAMFSPGFDFVIDQWEAFDVPSQTELLTSDGKFILIIHRAEDPASNFEFGKNEIFTIKADDDSTELYCRMIRPSSLDENKKYPAIIYVYGGPHAQLVNNTWHNDVRWWQYYMASKGYILFTVDNRGSANRGEAFENIIHRNLGIVETKDQMKGVEFLKSLPYVDENRIGVHGWSYGGFMTLNLMLRHPETFKVGVAGGPVVDWSMYEIMYGERYMDMPQQNPEGYRQSNMINHIDQLQGKLILIHGVQDETVVMQHSMKLLRESVKKNKQVDFFPYPVHPHNVHGRDRIHLMEKISQYFFDYL